MMDSLYSIHVDTFFRSFIYFFLIIPNPSPQTLGYCPLPFVPSPYSDFKQPEVCSDFKFSPGTIKTHKSALDRRLAYSVLWDMSTHSECMTSHCVAAFLLMYRQGMTFSLLEESVVDHPNTRP